MSATSKPRYDRRAAAIRTNPNRKGMHYRCLPVGEEEEERAAPDPYRLLIVAVIEKAVEDLHREPKSTLGYEARKWLNGPYAPMWMDMLDLDLDILKERVDGDGWAIVVKSHRSY